MSKISQELTARYYSNVFGHHDGYIGKRKNIKVDRQKPCIRKARLQTTKRIHNANSNK